MGAVSHRRLAILWFAARRVSSVVVSRSPAWIEIILREAGQGSPVLVPHGAPGPDRIAAFVDHLAIGHRVVASTHRAWDDTSRPEALTTVTDLADAYLDLLDAFSLIGVSVLGTSFGG
jgi:pimeloyl-ACP methyl ester carboxylesterase